MKKIMNYSLLMFLFSLISTSCSKTDIEEIGVNSNSNNITTITYPVNIGGYGFQCLSQSGSQWTLEVIGGARHGLSNLQLELLECPEEVTGSPTTVILGENEVLIETANIKINNITYPLVPIYNLDGSCVSEKGTDFTSFVKFEFDNAVIGNTSYKLDELVKKFGGTITFTLSHTDIILSGMNILVKTGGKDNKCYKNIIGNCYGCEPVLPPSTCSFSQGRFFNPGNNSKHWPVDINSVTVGTTTIQKGDYTLPATSPKMKAYFQAATLILSETVTNDISTTTSNNLPEMPVNVKAAFDYIVTYFSTNNLNENPSTLENTNLQNAAGIIGNWIDSNHC
jgi:hypothetical protein